MPTLSSQVRNVADLEDYDLRSSCGFLPESDPLPTLPSKYEAWNQAAAQLPKLLMTDHIRNFLREVPLLEISGLKSDAELRCAMRHLSYIGHAYVWGEEQAAISLPKNIAQPWFEISQKLGRPPVLSYGSYALDNWRRIVPEKPIALGNIALLQNFLGGMDEEWFILIHIDIEAKAGPALTGAVEAQKAAQQSDNQALLTALEQMELSLEQMYSTMARMPEHCDPYIYYHRVRPYIHGWKNNPALPEGLIYEGVTEYKNQPQQFRGETGAQSSIIPCMDAVLGVFHKDDPMKPYLLEMRDYMSPKHRSFMEMLETGSSVREHVQKLSDSKMSEVYNTCVSWVEQFRSLHLEYAARYIFKQHQTDAKNPAKVGTGGTPFMKYLKKHRDETTEHIIQ